mmetsp:Transcript_42605/g.68647  ORF Transcript_42605/g.68647 Transcript_42605/m.68647 type:complete len:543 (+) Transcript_42605:601-2229(+)
MESGPPQYSEENHHRSWWFVKYLGYENEREAQKRQRRLERERENRLRSSIEKELEESGWNDSMNIDSNENSPLQEYKAGYGAYLGEFPGFRTGIDDFDPNSPTSIICCCCICCRRCWRSACVPCIAKYCCCACSTARGDGGEGDPVQSSYRTPLASIFCVCVSKNERKKLREYWASHFWTYFFLFMFVGISAALLAITIHPRVYTNLPPPYPTGPPSSQSTTSPLGGGNITTQGYPPGQGKAPWGCLSSPCSDDATCTNMDEISGIFQCTCNKGFVGDGLSCVKPSKLGPHKFSFDNQCGYDIWVGVHPPTVDGGGFYLGPGLQTTKTVPQGFNGRFWPRTHCLFDKNGEGNCLTGDCGGGLKCTGGGKTPVSLAEFNLDAGAPWDPAGVLDWYDVSLVDGYNVPVSIYVVEGTYLKDPYQNPDYDCTNAICLSDINPLCPERMQLKPKDALEVLPPSHVRKSKKISGETIACHSACDAFGDARYCCTAQYSLPTTCPPTKYSQIFKDACPGAYSYAYDDKSSLFTCRSAEDRTSSYTIKFC